MTEEHTLQRTMEEALVRAYCIRTDMVQRLCKYIWSPTDDQAFGATNDHLCAYLQNSQGKVKATCSLPNPQFAQGHELSHLERTWSMNERATVSHPCPVECPPFSSFMASTRQLTSSCMRCSKLFFPNPKFLSVIRANLLCSFHVWPLEKSTPGKKTFKVMTLKFWCRISSWTLWHVKWKREGLKKGFGNCLQRIPQSKRHDDSRPCNLQHYTLEFFMYCVIYSLRNSACLLPTSNRSIPTAAKKGGIHKKLKFSREDNCLTLRCSNSHHLVSKADPKST